MGLTEKQVKEFQEIYKKEFGEEISYEKAYEKGTNLVQLFEAVFKPRENTEKKDKNKDEDDF
jgi:hypothetical protein